MESSLRLQSGYSVLVVLLALCGLQTLQVSANIAASAKFITTAEGELALDVNGDGRITNTDYIVRLPRTIDIYQRFGSDLPLPSTDVTISILDLQNQLFQLQGNSLSEQKLNIAYLNQFITKYCGQSQDQFYSVRGLGNVEATIAAYFEAVAAGSYSGVYRPRTTSTQFRVIHPKVRTLLTTSLSLRIRQLLEQEIQVAQQISAFRLANSILISINQLINQELQAVVANIVAGYSGAAYCLADQQGQIGGVVSVGLGKVLQARPGLISKLVGGLLGNVVLVVQSLLDGVGRLVGGVVGGVTDIIGGVGKGVAGVLDGLLGTLGQILGGGSGGGLLGGLLGGLFGGGGGGSEEGCNTCP